MTDSFFPKPNNNFTLPPEVKSAIDIKTAELYEKRITLYAKNISPENKQAIINLQKLIFTLDYYSEHNAELNPVILDSFWKQAEKFLSDLGVEKSLQTTLLQEIEDYADVEGNTRAGKKLADVDIESFYFLKSCDVRMQRHLIRYLNHEPPISTDSEISRDVLEEIEDDIDDLAEDEATSLGGNRILEILRSNDFAKLEEYVAYMESLPNPPQELIKKIRTLISQLQFALRSPK